MFRLFSGPASKPETLMDKTKKFLAALVKFGSSVSPSVGTNVRKLVFRLAVSILLINRKRSIEIKLQIEIVSRFLFT